MECFRLLFDHIAWIEHQYLSGIRDSRKAGSLWGMMRGVWGVRKSIHQSWSAKGLGLGLLCWGFKGVQEEIPSEEASSLQIGSVAFPPGQCTSPQLLRKWKRLWWRSLIRSHKRKRVASSYFLDVVALETAAIEFPSTTIANFMCSEELLKEQQPRYYINRKTWNKLFYHVGSIFLLQSRVFVPGE